MRRKLGQIFRPGCEHEDTLVVSSVGVRRVVCERCGHISFEISPGLGRARSSVKRDQLRRVG